MIFVALEGLNEQNFVTETQYDLLGRAKQASNPYRLSNDACYQNSQVVCWTSSSYDELGRLKFVTSPDNAVVETNYDLATTGAEIGTVAIVIDQALKQRRSVTNAVGQLIRVDEPSITHNNQLGEIDAPNQPTKYEYDGLNNLKKVIQDIQTRTFSYDSLSRLKSATNPESGAISYNYDANSNLINKTDARNITTTYGYDRLNRVITRSYSDNLTPTVNYYYDGKGLSQTGTFTKGKLTKVTSAVSATEYTNFDGLGRLQNHQQTTDGNTYPTSYVYNLSGALLEETYPSGRKVQNTLDQDGDLQQVQSKKVNDTFKNYANSFNYTAAGAVSSVRLGNGRWENTSFNNRLQPTQIGLGTSATNQSLLKLDYEYGELNLGTGQVIAGTNNGNIAKQTITVQNTPQATGFTATQYYAYDSLNRIKIASENLTPNGGALYNSWKQTFQFDRYGNRRFDTANNNTTTLDPNCAEAVCNPQISTANNRLIGTSYDNGGNTTTDANGRTFTYDGENKQIKVQTGATIIGEYSYDGEGRRIKKIVPNTGEITIFVYDAGGKMVAEYSTIVEPTSTAKISYLTNDHLGSPRIITDQNGAVISRRDFMPFGEEISRANYGNDSIREKFATYERDNETNLDFAQARMYAKNLGRFTATDPIILNELRMKNPQVFNAYSYTANNPLKFIDPNGEDLIAADEQQARDIKRLAPGSKIDANGNVKKPNFFRRIWNRLTGHGAGTKLISQLVDSKQVTTAFTWKGVGNGVTLKIDTDSTNAKIMKNVALKQGVSEEILSRTNILVAVGDNASLPERTSDGKIEDTKRDAILLGHELIHASHIIDGSYNPKTAQEGKRDFSENGVNYTEKAAQEELRTVGLSYNKSGDITENQLRKELGYRPRATYLKRDEWELRK